MKRVAPVAQRLSIGLPTVGDAHPDYNELATDSLPDAAAE